MTSELIKLLLVSAIIREKVGTRIYPVALANVKNPTFPCIAVDRSVPGDYDSKLCQIGSFIFRITSCSKNPDEAEEIQGEVIDVLNGKSISNSRVHGFISCEASLILYSDEDLIYYASNAFSFGGKIQ